MITITVMRGAGDKPADEIINPLSASISSLTALGASEINSRESIYQTTINVKFRKGVLLGQLIQCYNTETNKTWFGKITGITHNWDGPEVTTTLKVERKP